MMIDVAPVEASVSSRLAYRVDDVELQWLQVLTMESAGMERAGTRAGATETGLRATVADCPETSVAACSCDPLKRARGCLCVCLCTCRQCRPLNRLGYLAAD